MTLIDDFHRLFTIFSVIVFLAAGILVFRQHKLPATLLFLGVAAKYTPSTIMWYLLVPDNAYMTWKFKLITLLQPLGGLLIAASLLVFVWRLQAVYVSADPRKNANSP